MCWNIFQHKKRNFVSPSGHVMFYLLYKHQWNTIPFHFSQERRDLICNHSNGNLFTYEDNMLFSRVKICFRAKAHLVFHWCLYNKERYWSQQYARRVSYMNPVYGLIHHESLIAQWLSIWPVCDGSQVWFLSGTQIFLCPTLVTSWTLHLPHVNV